MRDTRSLLLELLGSGADPAQDEAACRLRVSPRTARRHLRRLEGEGLVEVVKDGAYKRYRVVPAHRVTDPQQVSFTEGEVEALTVAVLAARSLLAPTPFGGSLATAQGKLERAWLSKLFSFEPEAEPSSWHFDEVTGGTPVPFDPACFEALLEAVRNRRPVRVTYRTASRNAVSTDRLLRPLGFLVRAGAWMIERVPRIRLRQGAEGPQSHLCGIERRRVHPLPAPASGVQRRRASPSGRPSEVVAIHKADGAVRR